jgi:inorganic pyrophosphatase
MNLFTDFNPTKITPDDFVAIVEISKGSKTKYELDKETGALKLDRILFTSSHYPDNYGFIPCTLAEDNDPLDVLILMSESIVPLTEVHCKPIGVFIMTDQGQLDEKIIAVCPEDPIYGQYKSIEELPPHHFQEIKYFFETYKTLEGKQTSCTNVMGKQKAIDIIDKCISAFKDWKKTK